MVKMAASRRPDRPNSLLTTLPKDEYDFDEENSVDYDDCRDFDDQQSDEDTEDASETDMVKQEEEYSELKEQLNWLRFYQDKLTNLKKQLEQLEEGCHAEYNRRLKILEQAYKERLRLAEVLQEYEISRVDREYEKERESADIELEEKMIELRENLLGELEDKKRMIESERSTVELTGDSMEVKPVTTRKLRRRPNDPIPLPEKRRKTSPAQLHFLLDDNAVMEDLKILNKGKPIPPLKKPSSGENKELMLNSPDGVQFDVKIEDGKLCYEKRWFHRGQTVYVESKETGKFSGVISTVGTTDVWVRKTLDNSKVRIYVQQLQKGKFTIRRRST